MFLGEQGKQPGGVTWANGIDRNGEDVCEGGVPFNLWEKRGHVIPKMILSLESLSVPIFPGYMNYTW